MRLISTVAGSRTTPLSNSDAHITTATGYRCGGHAVIARDGILADVRWKWRLLRATEACCA
jgi:hypothetical protein